MFKTLNSGDDFLVVCVKAAEISLAFWVKNAISVLLYLTPHLPNDVLDPAGEWGTYMTCDIVTVGKNYFLSVFFTYSSILTFNPLAAIPSV